MLQRENVDKCLKYFHLVLKHDLEHIPERPLPQGYSFCFYQLGDEEKWLEIEASAREFLTPESGRKSWEKYFGGKETELAHRMLFVVNEAGEKVATASAFYDDEDREAGWLHWVAVKKEYQGKGISKPLVYKVLSILKELGYPYACVPTQTTTWLAVKIYMDCGFVPLNTEKAKEGWRIVKTLTDHPLLSGFEPLSEADMLDRDACRVRDLLSQRYPDLLDFVFWQAGETFRAGALLPKGAVYCPVLRDRAGNLCLGAPEEG